MLFTEVREPVYLHGSKLVTAFTYQPHRERGRHFTPELHLQNTGVASGTAPGTLTQIRAQFMRKIALLGYI